MSEGDNAVRSVVLPPPYCLHSPPYHSTADSLHLDCGADSTPPSYTDSIAYGSPPLDTSSSPLDGDSSSPFSGVHQPTASFSPRRCNSMTNGRTGSSSSIDDESSPPSYLDVSRLTASCQVTVVSRHRPVAADHKRCPSLWSCCGVKASVVGAENVDKTAGAKLFWVGIVVAVACCSPILGGLAIYLAVKSKRCGNNGRQTARESLAVSIAAIVVNCVLIAFVVFICYLLFIKSSQSPGVPCSVGSSSSSCNSNITTETSNAAPGDSYSVYGIPLTYRLDAASIPPQCGSICPHGLPFKEYCYYDARYLCDGALEMRGGFDKHSDGYCYYIRSPTACVRANKFYVSNANACYSFIVKPVWLDGENSVFCRHGTIYNGICYYDSRFSAVNGTCSTVAADSYGQCCYYT